MWHQNPATTPHLATDARGLAGHRRIGLPLMVAVGSASDGAGHQSYRQRDFAGSLAMSGYRFGNEEGPATIMQTAR